MAAKLNSGVDDLNNALMIQRNRLLSALKNSACTTSVFCQNLLSSVSMLDPTNIDFSNLENVQSEIDRLNQTLTKHNVDGEVSKVHKELDDIPNVVSSGSGSTSTNLLETVDKTNNTIALAFARVPLSEFERFEAQLKVVKDQFTSTVASYKQSYDGFRYYGAILLAVLITLIVLCYVVGVMLQIVNIRRSKGQSDLLSKYINRAFLSGVVLSFLSSWSFMIMVMVALSRGGPGERYFCQNFEPPYYGLKFLDRVFNHVGGGLALHPPTNVSLYQLLMECQRNSSLYHALQLDQVFGLDYVPNEIEKLISGINDKLADYNLNLSNIRTYTDIVADTLNDLKDTGLGGINFTNFIKEINKGVFYDGIAGLASTLNFTSGIFNSSLVESQTSLSLARTLQSSLVELSSVILDKVNPMQNDLRTLNISVATLKNVASGFDDRVTSTAAALQRLDSNIDSHGNKIIKTIASQFANGLISEVIDFTNWFVIQVTQNLGKCRPVYLVYTQAISLMCDYMMDILNGFWFSLGWCSFFMLPAAMLAIKMTNLPRSLASQEESRLTKWAERIRKHSKNGTDVQEDVLLAEEMPRSSSSETKADLVDKEVGRPINNKNNREAMKSSSEELHGTKLEQVVQKGNNNKTIESFVNASDSVVNRTSFLSISSKEGSDVDFSEFREEDANI